MNDDDVTRRITAVEQALAIDDPAFVHRVDRVAKRDAHHAVTIGVLLAVGAMLLTTGVGTLSALLWASGLSALVAAMALDALYKRRLRRAR